MSIPDKKSLDLVQQTSENRYGKEFAHFIIDFKIIRQTISNKI